MHRKVSKVRLPAITTVAMLLACGGDVNHTSYTHAQCDSEYNQYWAGSGLKLVHDDGRDCPLNKDAGEQVHAGGSIVDTKVEDPNYPGEGPYGERVELSVWNFIEPSPGSLIKERSADFSLQLAIYDLEEQFEWIAQPSVNYPRGDVNPDFAIFKVRWTNHQLPKPEALMTITYDTDIIDP